MRPNTHTHMHTDCDTFMVPVLVLDVADALRCIILASHVIQNKFQLHNHHWSQNGIFQVLDVRHVRYDVSYSLRFVCKNAKSIWWRRNCNFYHIFIFSHIFAGKMLSMPFMNKRQSALNAKSKCFQFEIEPDLMMAFAFICNVTE